MKATIPGTPGSILQKMKFRPVNTQECFNFDKSGK